jgi:putative hydrolase of the HAD superfamily
VTTVTDETDPADPADPRDEPTATVKACLIDVYDTILRSAFHDRMSVVTGPLGISLDGWLAEWDKTRHARDRGELTIAASYAGTLRAVGVDPEPEVVAGLVRRDAEFSRAHTRLFDDTLPFLGWLRSRGVLIALVSNCADTTREVLADLGVLPLADAAVLSCEVGSIKPEPEIYATALAELGVAAADAVFVDDQPGFCAGAQALGIRAIQIARDEPGGPLSRFDFPVVHSLLDLKSLL